MGTELRDALRRLVDVVPEDKLVEAQQYLESLVSWEHPVSRALRNAPEVEPTEEEIALLEDARKRDAEGRAEYVTDEEARRILLGGGR